MSKWAIYEEQWLKKNFDKYSDTELAEKLGKTVNAVEHKRRNLLLKKVCL